MVGRARQLDILETRGLGQPCLGVRDFHQRIGLLFDALRESFEKRGDHFRTRDPQGIGRLAPGLQHLQHILSRADRVFLRQRRAGSRVVRLERFGLHAGLPSAGDQDGGDVVAHGIGSLGSCTVLWIVSDSSQVRHFEPRRKPRTASSFGNHRP